MGGWPNKFGEINAYNLLQSVASPIFFVVGMQESAILD